MTQEIWPHIILDGFMGHADRLDDKEYVATFLDSLPKILGMNVLYGPKVLKVKGGRLGALRRRQVNIDFRSELEAHLIQPNPCPGYISRTLQLVREKMTNRLHKKHRQILASNTCNSQDMKSGSPSILIINGDASLLVGIRTFGQMIH